MAFVLELVFLLQKMPNLKNKTKLDELKTALAKSKAVVLTNYAGLPVNAQNQLREAIRASGAEFFVTKNTLMALALKESLGELPQAMHSALEGQTATLFVVDDPVSPTKALVKFISEHEDKPEIKIGIMDGKIISVSDITALSKLPGREELLGMLVGQLNAPIAGFAQVLRANLQNLVFALDAVRRKQA